MSLVSKETFIQGIKSLHNLPSNYRFLANESMISCAINKCANEIINYCNSKNSNVELHLLCILKGGVYFNCDLMRSLQVIIQRNNLPIKLTCGFISAKSYHGLNQSEVKIEHDLNLEELKNKEIILVDELIDNGETILTIKNYLINKGITNINECVAFMKNKNRVIEPKWYGFLVPDVWLIGYGLDDMERYRELKMLCFIGKPDNFEKTKDDYVFCSNDDYYDAWFNYYKNLN